MIASRQTSALFSDKEQVWADNAAVEPVLRQRLRLLRRLPRQRQRLHEPAAGRPHLARRRRQLDASSRSRRRRNNIHSRNGFGRSGCTVRTDSHGVVYVFDFQFGFSPTTAAAGQIQMIQLLRRRRALGRARCNIFTAFDTCNFFEPSIGRCVEDGVGGARSDLSPAPSVDIANGAPSAPTRPNRHRHHVGRRRGRAQQRARDVHHARPTAARVDDAGPGRARRRPRLLLGARDLARTAPTCGSSTTRSPSRSRTAPRARRTTGRWSARCCTRRSTGGAVGAFAEVHRGAAGRRARLVAERPRGGVPRRLRLRGGDAHVRRERLERRAQRRGLPGGRRVPPGAARGGGRPPASRRPRPRSRAARRTRARREERAEEAEAPAVQQVCPATFGNSDIFGWSSLAAP